MRLIGIVATAAVLATVHPAWGQARTAVAADVPQFACPEGSIAGCNKGVWATGQQAHGSLIAVLNEPATYKICINGGSTGAVMVWVDGTPNFGESRNSQPVLFPSQDKRESNCALVTGSTLIVQEATFRQGSSYGTYERIESENRLKHLFRFELQGKANPPQPYSALLAVNSAEHLYRVCLSPIEPMEFPQSYAIGSRHLLTEKGFIPWTGIGAGGWGWGISSRSCVDVQARRLAIFGDQPGTDEAFSGFVAY